MTVSAKPSVWHALLNRRMLVCIVLGFSSGLPLYLLINLVPAWFQSEGLSLKTIGAFTLTQLPYAWKFLWAPFMDRFTLPVLGRRRGWMVASQLALLAAIAGLGRLAPAQQTGLIVAVATLIAFLSATQDIVLDAYRRELLPELELGLGNAFHVNAYKIASLVPGGLALILSDRLPWPAVFAITAAFMAPGALMTVFAPEPQTGTVAPRTMLAAVVEPFHEFFSRHGVRSALWVLAFIFCYKLGDSLCTALATPFYMQMGFTKTQIGFIAKSTGLWCNVAGGLLGGLWMVRLGINRALWLFGVAQGVAMLGFAWLAWQGPAPADAGRLIDLAWVIGIEAAGVGLGTTALVAYMARTTHPAYTATQLALFTSLMAVPRTLVNASAGWLVEALGWLGFFGLCLALAIPGMLLLLKVAPWQADERA